MKTNELTGAALDWAVSQCEGLNPLLVSSFEGGCVEGLAGYPFVYLHEPMKHNIAAPAFYTGYTPSASWWLGGEIIARERISLIDQGGDCWLATCGWTEMFGDTYLIAAMRSYVASKLGNEVQIPEELIK